MVTFVLNNTRMEAMDRLRAALALDTTRAGAHFDEIRRRYALRRELAAY
ncbi:MAG: hypothetical protein RL667_484, partial [Pseudomonadota bacterium]